jgi:hypothetical protein
VSPGPELTGVQYITLQRTEGGPESLTLGFDGDPEASWSVQAVPGIDGSDGEVLDLEDGEAVLRFGELAERTLVILALPPDAESADPDARTTDRYEYTLVLE